MHSRNLLGFVKALVLIGVVVGIGGCIPFWQHPEPTTLDVFGVVELPPESSLEASGAVVCAPGDASLVENDGTFTVSVPKEGLSAVSITFPNGLVLMNLVGGDAAGSFGTLSLSSPNSNDVSVDNVTCNVDTTAESLVFLYPLVFHSDPTRARRITEVIHQTKEVSFLAQRLSEVAGSTNPMGDSQVLNLYGAAVRAVLGNLDAEGPSSLLRNPSSNPVRVLNLPVHTTEGSLLSGKTLKLPSLLAVPMDLNWITLTKSEIEQRDNKYVLKPYLNLHEPTTWLLQVNELDPATYPDLRAILDLTNTSELAWLQDGYKDATSLPGNSCAQYVDLLEVGISALLDLALGPSSDEQTRGVLEIPADRPGAYVVAGSSGGSADLEELAFLMQGEANSLLSSWGHQYVGGVTMNAMKVVLNIVSCFIVIDNTPEMQEVLYKTIQGTIMSVWEAVQPEPFDNPEAVSVFLQNMVIVVTELLYEQVLKTAIEVAAKTALETMLQYLLIIPEYLAIVSNGGEALDMICSLYTMDSPLERTIIFVSSTAETSPPPNIPSMPSGPSSGQVAEDLKFSTEGASCGPDHQVEYQFDWGDATSYSNWGPSTNATHSYSSAGTYQVRSRARCTNTVSVASQWSNSLAVVITQVNPPDPPTNIAASRGDYVDKVRLTWSKSTGATRYKIYRACPPEWQDYDLVATTGDVTYWDDTDTKSSERYFYKIQACNESDLCSQLVGPYDGWAHPLNEPDLIITSLGPPLEITSPVGEGVKLVATVRNQGGGSSPATRLHWWMSDTPSSTGSPSYSATVRVLAPGEEVVLDEGGIVSHEERHAYFFAYVDYVGWAEESDEDNNWSANTCPPGYIEVWWTDEPEEENPITLELYEPTIHDKTVIISGNVGTIIEIDGSTIDGPLYWNWGDGTGSDSWFPATHTYAQYGTYTIKATAFSSNGYSLSKSLSVDVLYEEPDVPDVNIEGTWDLYAASEAWRQTWKEDELVLDDHWVDPEQSYISTLVITSAANQDVSGYMFIDFTDTELNELNIPGDGGYYDDGQVLGVGYQGEGQLTLEPCLISYRMQGSFTVFMDSSGVFSSGSGVVELEAQVISCTDEQLIEDLENDRYWEMLKLTNVRMERRP